jgi:hypothetical protein
MVWYGMVWYRLQYERETERQTDREREREREQRVYYDIDITLLVCFKCMLLQVSYRIAPFSASIA